MASLWLTIGSLSLGGGQEVYDGAATFEVSLDAISTTDLFDTFTKTLCVGYDIVAFTLNFFSDSMSTCGTLVVTPSMAWLEDLLSLFSTLFKAQLGYLHLGESFPEVSLFLVE